MKYLASILFLFLVSLQGFSQEHLFSIQGYGTISSFPKRQYNNTTKPSNNTSFEITNQWQANTSEQVIQSTETTSPEIIYDYMIQSSIGASYQYVSKNNLVGGLGITFQKYGYHIGFSNFSNEIASGSSSYKTIQLPLSIGYSLGNNIKILPKAGILPVFIFGEAYTLGLGGQAEVQLVAPLTDHLAFTCSVQGQRIIHFGNTVTFENPAIPTQQEIELIDLTLNIGTVGMGIQIKL
ncbi:hypothetical protein [Algivirga pacifica]|uniref:Outer membrane protein beta-barrel domain-containing protein n=1 Tax=Algivirga pacifica TaxID=1162670 RepID=A0ABP9DGJ0_9BACT